MSAISESLLVAAPDDCQVPLGERTLRRAVPWLVGALVVAVGVLLVDGLPVGVMWDDGMYVVLARALATGQGFRWINLPGAPPATHFPPGYPALLALFWWLAPSLAARVVLFKLLNACFLGVVAALVICLLRERWRISTPVAVAFVLAATLGIPMLALSVVVMSEPCFLALVLAALLAAERAAQSRQTPLWRVVLLGAACGAVTLVRTQGIALVAALPLVLVARRRGRDAAVCLGASLLIMAPWQLWVATHAGAVPPVLRGSYGSYAGWLVAGVRSEGLMLFARATVRNTAASLAMLETFVAPGLPAAVRVLAAVGLISVSAVGVRPLAREAPVTATFVLLYLGVVLLWPFPPARFIWGVWPLIVLVPVLGSRELLGWRPASRPMIALRITAIGAAVLLAVGHLGYTVRGYRGRWWGSIPRGNALQLRPLVAWARRTAPGAVLGVESESAVFLYSGRTAVPIQTFTAAQFFRGRTAEENASVIREILSTYPVSAIAVAGPVTRDAARVLANAHPPELVVRDTFPGGLVLVPSTR